MKTLVYIEHEGGEVRDATLSAVTAAASEISATISFISGRSSRSS